MSRFKMNDRETIHNKILCKGEKLFLDVGLRQTTIEMITNEVGIGKGTFYHFFQNKESLYLHIYLTKQNKVFEKAYAYLENHKAESARTRCLNMMLLIVDNFWLDPILSITDTDLLKQINDKAVLPEQLSNDQADTFFLEQLKKQGISFLYPLEMILDITHLACMDAIILKGKDHGEEKARLLLTAIINQFVKEDSI